MDHQVFMMVWALFFGAVSKEQPRWVCHGTTVWEVRKTGVTVTQLKCTDAMPDFVGPPRIKEI